MKKPFVVIVLLEIVLSFWSTAVAIQPVPNVGNGRIRVLGNNLQNYYYNYSESSRPSYNDDAGRAEKTHKIMDMMLTADADIYAFCEVEAKPIVLQQLVDSLNQAVGTIRYAAISDNINVATDQYDNAIKSGFIYRLDKVTPYGNNYDLLIAGSMFGIIPILVIYLIFQKYLIDGMTAGAVKG
jgi:predicted extracellular nuclease